MAGGVFTRCVEWFIGIFLSLFMGLEVSCY
jgi:hypothetical protein